MFFATYASTGGLWTDERVKFSMLRARFASRRAASASRAPAARPPRLAPAADLGPTLAAPARRGADAAGAPILFTMFFAW